MGRCLPHWAGCASIVADEALETAHLMNLSPIIAVRFDQDRLCLAWADGLSLHQPLARYRPLQEATPEQREDFRIHTRGLSVCWPHLGKAGVHIGAIDWIWEHLCLESQARLQSLAGQLDELPEDDQCILALWRLQTSAHNGGSLQCLSNGCEAFDERALHALTAIGARHTRSVLSRHRQSMGTFANLPSRQRQQGIAQPLSGDAHERLGEMLHEQLRSAMEELPALAVKYFYVG